MFSQRIKLEQLNPRSLIGDEAKINPVSARQQLVVEL